MTQRTNSIEHLYIHVPFCKSICFYCDFCHTLYNEKLVQEWLKALQKEFSFYPIQDTLKTIYIGGGTPTSLEDEYLEQLLQLLDSYRNNIQEYTIEINPETLTLSKALLLKNHGINRVSLGIQAYQEHHLSFMNRHHRFEDVVSCMKILREVGIKNIAVDIMYSLPNQTMEDLKETVNHVLELKPSHISIYSLLIEEGTLFKKKGITSLDEEIEASMYEYLIERFENEGYHQYEISNFCLEGKESKHNLAYWEYKDFYGYSCGASGKENHHRYDHTKLVQSYIQNSTERIDIPLTKEDEMFEMLMMSLRLKRGIDKNLFYERFNESLDSVFGDINQRLIYEGLLEEDETYLRCTKKGYPILNTVLEYYL